MLLKCRNVVAFSGRQPALQSHSLKVTGCEFDHLEFKCIRAVVTPHLLKARVVVFGKLQQFPVLFEASQQVPSLAHVAGARKDMDYGVDAGSMKDAWETC